MTLSGAATAFEAIAAACGKLSEGKKKPEKGTSVEEVMGFANQNLGIYLYEAVVNRFTRTRGCQFCV